MGSYSGYIIASFSLVLGGMTLLLWDAHRQYRLAQKAIR